MKISVLMSTYNGEKYIVEQMESIHSQTRKPDEVVIIDDCSTDETVKKIESYINNNGLVAQWKLYSNNSNKGWRINFIEGLKYIEGDILFFSDQDDIWFKNKIETYCKIFEHYPNVNVVVSGEILWESSEAKPLCIIENVDHTILELSKHADEYLIHTSGCCMAIRMEYANQKLKYWFPGWAHDDFFWKMGILDRSLAYIHTNSVLHRITGVNESRKKSTLEKAIWSSEIDIQIAKKLLQRLYDESISNSDEKIVIIKHKLEGAMLRLKMLKCKSPLIALKMIIHYQDLYRKKRQIIGDCLRSLHIMN